MTVLQKHGQNSLILPKKIILTDYMQVGRAYYNGEKYKSADSVFSVVLKKSPDYLPAYLYDCQNIFKNGS